MEGDYDLKDQTEALLFHVLDISLNKAIREDDVDFFEWLKEGLLPPRGHTEGTRARLNAIIPLQARDLLRESLLKRENELLIVPLPRRLSRRANPAARWLHSSVLAVEARIVSLLTAQVL